MGGSKLWRYSKPWATSKSFRDFSDMGKMRGTTYKLMTFYCRRIVVRKKRSCWTKLIELEWLSRGRLELRIVATHWCDQPLEFRIQIAVDDSIERNNIWMLQLGHDCDFFADTLAIVYKNKRLTTKGDDKRDEGSWVVFHCISKIWLLPVREWAAIGANLGWPLPFCDSISVHHIWCYRTLH